MLCNVLQCVMIIDIEALVWCAVCCSVLQCVAVCCSVLQCVAVCCSVLQCVAVLQCVITLDIHSRHIQALAWCQRGLLCFVYSQCQLGSCMSRVNAKWALASGSCVVSKRPTLLFFARSFRYTHKCCVAVLQCAK